MGSEQKNEIKAILRLWQEELMTMNKGNKGSDMVTTAINNEETRLTREKEIDATWTELEWLRQRFDELYLEIGGANAENEMMWIITEERRLEDRLVELANEAE